MAGLSFLSFCGTPGKGFVGNELLLALNDAELGLQERVRLPLLMGADQVDGFFSGAGCAKLVPSLNTWYRSIVTPPLPLLPGMFLGGRSVLLGIAGNVKAQFIHEVAVRLLQRLHRHPVLHRPSTIPA